MTTAFATLSVRVPDEHVFNGIPVGLSEEDKERFKDALGYTVPETVKPLARALNAIGCKVFEPFGVRSYMHEVAASAYAKAEKFSNRVKRYANAKAWNDRTDEDRSVWFFGAWVIGVVGVLFVSALILEAQAKQIIRPILTLILFCSIGVMTVAVALSWIIYKYAINPKLSPVEYEAAMDRFKKEAELFPFLKWATSPLQEYKTGLVPRSVLLLACEVKEACPKAELLVHHTTVTALVSVAAIEEEVKRRWSDPFLEVRLGEESYFIAAWDEKGFRALKVYPN